jgi:hypothetical protein
MLNFQLAIQPKTEQRLRKILNNTQDVEAFAQGIINYQITELQKAILKSQLDLQSYEKSYQMPSDSFYEKFLQGDLNDDEDFIIWSGLYELLIENKNKLCELK